MGSTHQPTLSSMFPFVNGAHICFLFSQSCIGPSPGTFGFLTVPVVGPSVTMASCGGWPALMQGECSLPGCPMRAPSPQSGLPFPHRTPFSSVWLLHLPVALILCTPDSCSFQSREPGGMTGREDDMRSGRGWWVMWNEPWVSFRISASINVWQHTSQ